VRADNSCPVRCESLRILIALGIGTQGVYPIRARLVCNRYTIGHRSVSVSSADNQFVPGAAVIGIARLS
jgi:hypothetical protein